MEYQETLLIMCLLKLNLLQSMVLIKVTCSSIRFNCLSDRLPKTYYKEDFIAATMTTEMTNTTKLREFVKELKRLKVEVVKPSINECVLQNLKQKIIKFIMG